jgi:hypothetical protein
VWSFTSTPLYIIMAWWLGRGTTVSFHMTSSKPRHFLFTIHGCHFILSRSLSQYSIWLRAGRSGFNPRHGQRIFLLAAASRPALGPTQPPTQWVPGVLSPGVKRGRGVMLTTHPHLVPRLRMSRSYTSSPPCASMACSGTAYLFFYYISSTADKA